MPGLMLFANNAATTLASSITSTATSLTVATGTGALFPNPTGGQYFLLTLANTAGTVEIVKVTARTTDTFTITRGQDGTSAVAWNSGDKVEQRVVAADFNNLGQLDSTNTWAQVQTFSGGLSGALTGNVTGNASGTSLNVTGVVAIANGGTNNGSLAVTAGGVLYTDGSKVVNSGAITSGNVVIGGGTGAPTSVAPSTSGNVLTSNGTTWTSAAPVLGGMTLLGTMVTTSGSSVSLTGLTLTSYVQLYVVFNNTQKTSGITRVASFGSLTYTSNNNNTAIKGSISIDLITGYGFGTNTGGDSGVTFQVVGTSGYTTSTTTLTSSVSGTGGVFTGGSILVYGVK